MKFDAPKILESLPKTPKAALKKGPLMLAPVYIPPGLLERSYKYHPGGKWNPPADKRKLVSPAEAEMITAWNTFNCITLRVFDQRYLGCDRDYSALTKRNRDYSALIERDPKYTAFTKRRYSAFIERNRDVSIRSACDVNRASLNILKGEYKSALKRLRLCPFDEILKTLETSHYFYFNENLLSPRSEWYEYGYEYDWDTFDNWSHLDVNTDCLDDWPPDRTAVMAFNFAFLLFHGLEIEADEQAAVKLYKRIRTSLPDFLDFPEPLYVAPVNKESRPSAVRDRALKKAWDEVEGGNRKEALWRKLWMKNKGDESKTKFDYIEARINQISEKEAG